MPNVTAGLSFFATLTERRPEQDFGSGEVRCKSGWIEIGARFDENGLQCDGDCMPTHGYEPTREAAMSSVALQRCAILSVVGGA